MRTLLALAVLCSLASCSSPAPHGEPARLPPAQPQCDYVNYHRDESVNVQGPGKCTTDCDCDGMRSCIDATCTGTARPEPMDIAACERADYKWNEAWNGGGHGVCANDCECDGARQCAAGHCQAGPAPTSGDTSRTR